MKLRFQSSIDVNFTEQLSDLLYFNLNQVKYKEHIIDAINSYGTPVIKEKGKNITLKLEDDIETHTLFLIGSEDSKDFLLGVAVFFKKNDNEAILLHIAVNHTLIDSTFLTLQLIIEVKNYLKNIAGIRKLSLFYSDRITSLRIG